MNITMGLSGKSRLSFKPACQQQAKGFTLIELVIVLVIVAIGVALAVPSFQDTMQRRQTTSEAEQLAAFLNQAQSEAIKRNEQVRIHFDYTGPADWCFGAATATGTTICDCDVITDPNLADDPGNDSFCDIGGVRQTIAHSGLNKSAMITNTDSSFSFDPVRGSMTIADLGESLTPRAFVIESTNTRYQLQVEVTVIGRIRVCNSDAAKKVPGYRDCA